jgi:hypothetical protein
MAIRKSIEETLVVDGGRDAWLKSCRTALEREGFSKIQVAESLGQLHAAFRTKTIWGTLDITLTPEAGSHESTRLQLVATGNVDNIFALFRSPSKKILEEFKNGITPP